FCMAEFRASGHRCPPDVRQIRLPGTYEVVFCNSLVTHVPPDQGLALLGLLGQALLPGGVLMFTTQGETCLEHLAWYGDTFGAASESYRDAVATVGAYFVPYPRMRTYGITVLSKRFVERGMAHHSPRLEPVRFEARGMNGHQDFWAYRRPW